MSKSRMLCLLLSLSLSLFCTAQEMLCKVTVNASKITGVDARVFKTLENQITEFVNNRAWTQDVFAQEEKIMCSYFITIDKINSPDNYGATLTVQYSRPTFNSTYNSPILNFRDADLNFNYVENGPMDFNVNQYFNNLTSVIGFWTYVIIGLDYESMAKGTGQKYFTLSENIMTAAPQDKSAESQGWKSMDGNAMNGNRTRYQFIFSLQGAKYDVYKQAIYEYHYAGMDLFYDKPDAARLGVMNVLEKLEKVFRDNPNNVLITSFMFTKGDELVNIFSTSQQSEKMKAVTLMKKLDPSNGPKYDKLLRG